MFLWVLLFPGAWGALWSKETLPFPPVCLSHSTQGGFRSLEWCQCQSILHPSWFSTSGNSPRLLMPFSTTQNKFASLNPTQSFCFFCFVLCNISYSVPWNYCTPHFSNSSSCVYLHPQCIRCSVFYCNFNRHGPTIVHKGKYHQTASAQCRNF